RRVNQTGSRGKGKENSGKQEASWPVLHRTSRSQHVACPAEKGMSHVANIDKNNGLVYIIRTNKKPELRGQSAYNLMEISM
ncbi:hypothetical protein LEMLEM_LOCUS20454, partial [Lemmus lemmus]